MSDKIVKKDNLDELLNKLRQDYQIYTPAREGSSVTWQLAGKADELLWGFSNTDLFPKNFFFPQTECLMHFKNSSEDPQGMIMQEDPGLEQKRLLWGIRPCDAQAFKILDKVFCQDKQSWDCYCRTKPRGITAIG